MSTYNFYSFAMWNIYLLGDYLFIIISKSRRLQKFWLPERSILKRGVLYVNTRVYGV